MACRQVDGGRINWGTGDKEIGQSVRWLDGWMRDWMAREVIRLVRRMN